MIHSLLQDIPQGMGREHKMHTNTTATIPPKKPHAAMIRRSCPRNLFPTGYHTDSAISHMCSGIISLLLPLILKFCAGIQWSGMKWPPHLLDYCFVGAVLCEWDLAFGAHVLGLTFLLCDPNIGLLSWIRRLFWGYLHHRHTVSCINRTFLSLGNPSYCNSMPGNYD